MILNKIYEWDIEFTIVGPETPLENGLIDFLQSHDKLCFGPKRRSARIETSKEFARRLMQHNGMDKYSPFFVCLDEKPKRDLSCLQLFVRAYGGNFVIKPDGGCAGKGVKVSGDHFETLGKDFDRFS